MKLEPGRLKGSPQITAGHDALKGLMKLAEPGNKDINRARAAWTLHGIASGAGATDHSSLKLLKDEDPRLREMAVRMLGRDCRENGKVQYTKPEAKQPPPAIAHLDALKAMADDPDAGVRRELILAFRNLPTNQVGDSLRKLTAAWDGQDRWYLEALGLALEKRESDFVSTLFDGSLYGSLDLEKTGTNGDVALPPYFPVDRNEAFITTGTPDRAVSSVEQVPGFGMADSSARGVTAHRANSAGFAPVELQQAADDILERMNDPQTADLVAKMVARTSDPVHRRALLALLARRIGGDWNSASDARGDREGHRANA